MGLESVQKYIKRKGKIMKAAVKVKNLTKSFGKEKVLKGISHTFEAGKIHGIMGFNGSIPDKCMDWNCTDDFTNLRCVWTGCDQVF